MSNSNEKPPETYLAELRQSLEKFAAEILGRPLSTLEIELLSVESSNHVVMSKPCILGIVQTPHTL